MLGEDTAGSHSAAFSQALVLAAQVTMFRVPEVSTSGSTGAENLVSFTVEPSLRHRSQNRSPFTRPALGASELQGAALGMLLVAVACNRSPRALNQICC